MPIRWLEIAVPAHAEAVEAVSEILARVGYNGVAVEEPVDGDRDAMHVVKAYLVYDRVARIRVRRVRDAIGHLQAFGIGPIGELRTRTVVEEEWLETWKASFKPIRIGAFLIRPTWSDADPGDAIVLSLDPGMAFGTGLHPTTQACLRALSTVDVAGKRVADVGTGSAILAIAAAKRGARDVIAVDVDDVATREAVENVRRNGVAVVIAGGSAAELQGAYDVMIANIVAAVLQRIAPDLAAHLAPGGRLIVAGIIATEEDETRAAFEAHGLRVIGRDQDGDWVRLDLTR
ncbi:MAG TPA: 50S ribosomal protein L11 methyltransferase [Candidatus Limnocylindria bacterium]|nr:50S ribosomal protein L11 methyltransferase [Candidatus Limnocylindria bacterium]